MEKNYPTFNCRFSDADEVREAIKAIASEKGMLVGRVAREALVQYITKETKSKALKK